MNKESWRLLDRLSDKMNKEREKFDKAASNGNKSKALKHLYKYLEYSKKYMKIAQDIHEALMGGGFR
tara:strand:+ start:1022 stop:1222 length:201 start_codon:yes stop_codon:yes gene_type:complete